MSDIYQCAILNNAKDSVTFNVFETQVASMISYFEYIEIFWHPGLNIPVCFIPFLGLLIGYSYFITGLGMLTFWGNDMLNAIEKLVPPYNDVLTVEYITNVGKCKRTDAGSISSDLLLA